MLKATSVLCSVLSALVFALAIAAFTAQPVAAQTAKKLKCKGCVKSKQLKNNGVKSKDIKDGQVTNADLANGAVGAAKLGLANTIYLEDTGSDVGNCADLLDAMTGLVGPAAVVLGPGTYNCGFNTVTLPPQVSLIGSGRNLTTITGSISASNGVVRLLGDGSALRDVTVINDGAGATTAHFAVTIGESQGSAIRNWRISNVMAKAMNGSFLVGIFANFGDCDGGEMTDVTVTVSSGARNNRGIDFACEAGSTTGSNLLVTTTGAQAVGLAKFNSSVLTVRNSSFVGSTNSVSGSRGTLKVISSELDGPIFGPVICIGDYDEEGVGLKDGFFEDGSGGCE